MAAASAASNPAADPADLNRRGMQALMGGDSLSAAELFSAAAHADPGAPALWMNLATARRNLHDIEGERSALSRALALDQLHLMALIRMAELHERTGERAEAAEKWSGVLAVSAALADRPAGLDPVIDHAQRFVQSYGEGFASALDSGLAAARAGLSPRALRRFDACVAATTGRRQIYTNHCDGVHFPFLPADEFFDREHFPWLPQLEAATDVITAELQDLLTSGGAGLQPYVAMAPGTPVNKWTPLDNKLDWSAYFFWRFGERIDEHCARCPETARLIENLPLADMPGRGPTAFFSILKPHTRLPAHTGVTNLRAICHLALIVPPGCGFRVGGETRQWVPGEAFCFDDTIEHEAWNDSDELRAVLIVDTWNPHLTLSERELVREYFRVADRSGYGPRLAMRE